MGATMSDNSGKIMSPASHMKHGSIPPRSQNGAGSLVQSPTSVNSYPVCHMRSPTVQCVKLNIPNGTSYKTDTEREQKTDPKIIKTESVDIVTKALLSSHNRKLPDEQIVLVPDSTTNRIQSEQLFSCGDDVFVKQSDGRFYLGTIIEAEASKDRWLVRFGDNTERWAASSELLPLSSPGVADAPAMCVICKLSNNSNSDEVIACDKCSRGYHPSCLSPPVTSWIKDATWHCKHCGEQRHKVAVAENRAIQKAELIKMKGMPKALSYDPSKLNWDSLHQTNEDGIYCYCGMIGKWYAQMLQCARCRQWFHQNCISCLRYPVYSGDRFYMFVCSLCNFGTEFIGRKEMKWVDLVHLVLFNLTLYHSKKYFDLDTIIIPYTASNWFALQLPEKMQIASQSETREQILSALSNNENRFKCGKEIKKRTTIWGLRKRIPPPPPLTFTTPLPRGPISEETLSNRWGRGGSAFVSYHESQQSMVVPADRHWHSLMMGKQFQSSAGSDVESTRSTPSPMDIPDIPFRYQLSNNLKMNFSIKRDEGDESDNGSNDDMPLADRRNVRPVKMKKYKFHEINYQGGGYVKKSIPFPELALSKRQKNENLSKHRIKKRRETYSCLDYESRHDDETLSKSEKKLRKSLAKQQKMISQGTSTNDDDHNINRLLEIDTSKDDSNQYGSTMKLNEVVLPPTPPTSMSAPPTPPTITGQNLYGNLGDMSSDYQTSQLTTKEVNCGYDSDNDLANFKDDKPKQNDKSPIEIEKAVSDDESTKLNLRLNASKNIKLATINLEISKLSTKNIIEHSKIMSLHHMKSDDMYSICNQNKLENDSSGDDTSSRGTLDSIIPPPVNFQGANNPFHSVNNGDHKNGPLKSIGIVKGNSMTNKLSNKISKQNLNKKKNRISLPASLNPVIQPGVKLMKRKLSEKDLIIGPNGEVKRRRLRRTKASMNSQSNLLSNKDVCLNERQKSLRSSLGQEELLKNISSVTNVIQQMSTRSDVNAKGHSLRQRQEKNYSDSRRGSASSNNGIGSIARITNIAAGQSCRGLNLSPQKNQEEDIKDLKFTVHSYFGAPNRIAAGEKFTLSGKRLTESGKLQYLIEWEGHGS